MRLAIISTHPIQYNAPFFKALSGVPGTQVMVFYTWEQSQFDPIFDPGFNSVKKWDIPLLEGYDYVFLKNIAKKPGSHHFWGINNPTAINEISEWKPDALLVYGWSFYTHLKLLFHFKKKVPVYFRGDSILLNEVPGIKKNLRRIFLRFIYRKIDIALYVGIHNKNYFLVHGLKTAQLFFLPHVIDNERFAHDNELSRDRTLAIKNQLNIKDGQVVFLYCGKFEETKDLFLLINAFTSATLPDAHLVLVGGGVLEKKLRHNAAGYSNIHFLPFHNQSEMPLIYGLGNVFVLPSKGETWGLSVNEAMACGLAIIVSDNVGCWPDLVENGTNGFIFPSGEINDLVKIMQSIDIQNLNLMKFASKRMIDNFSIKKNALTLVNILNKK